MEEFGLFSNHSREEMMRAGRKGGTAARRYAFTEQSHQEAQRIIRLLEHRRQELGLASPIGRIGIAGIVGVNRSEKELRGPVPSANLNEPLKHKWV